MSDDTNVTPRLDSSVANGAKAPIRSGWLFIALALTAAIPVLLFGGWMAYMTADQQRSSARKAATEAVRQVDHSIETELRLEIEVAQALTNSGALDRGDINEFYREAIRLINSRPLWQTVSLKKPDGEQAFDVQRPLGAVVRAVSDQESFDAVLRSRTPVIGSLVPTHPGADTGIVPLRVPVTREGQLNFVLTIGLLPDQINSILHQAGIPAGWVGTVVDAAGHIVARTPQTTAAGNERTPAVQEATARAGTADDRTHTADGVEVETVRRPLANTEGWSIHLGIPASELNAPVSRSLGVLFGGAGASIALAIGLGLVIAREIAHRREMEAIRSETALKDSEQRGALAIDAAELGTWQWDLASDEFSGSHRFATLLRLETGPYGESRWPADKVLAAIDPADRNAVRTFATGCIQSGKSDSVEFRLADAGAVERWIRAAGRAEQSDRGPKRMYGVAADIELQKRAEADRMHLLRRLASAEEAEQRRISRELHDQVGQTVTGLSLGLKAIEQDLLKSASCKTVADKVRAMQKLAGEIGRDIHRAASELRPTALDDLGLFKAMAAYTEQWEERYGIAVDLQTVGRDSKLPLDTATVLYRLVQEALTNIVKHAAARRASIVVEQKMDALVLIIEDDGTGFEPERIASDPGACTGLGLSGMRERVTLIGGTLAIESTPGSGTTIFVTVPFQQDGGAS